MNPGTRVVFHRPGSTRTEIVWSGQIEGVENDSYLIRDEKGKLRVVPVNAKWLKEKEYDGQRTCTGKAKTENA